MMIEWRGSQPRWRQVYDLIKGQIETGKLAAGERVPSILEMHAEYGIANVTAQKVIRQLREDGLIHTEPGLGSFVAGRPADD